MSHCTESIEPLVSNPFAMMFPEHLNAMVTCAASSSLPSRHYSPLDKPTPTSVRTPQMQAADLLIEALAEVEDTGFSAQAFQTVTTPVAQIAAKTPRFASRPQHRVSLSRSELVRAVLA